MTSTKKNGKAHGTKTNGNGNGHALGSDADWRDVTGKFKIAFERMEKDQEENNAKVRRQTEAFKRHAGESIARTVKR